MTAQITTLPTTAAKKAPAKRTSTTTKPTATKAPAKRTAAKATPTKSVTTTKRGPVVNDSNSTTLPTDVAGLRSLLKVTRDRRWRARRRDDAALVETLAKRIDAITTAITDAPK